MHRAKTREEYGIKYAFRLGHAEELRDTLIRSNAIICEGFLLYVDVLCRNRSERTNVTLRDWRFDLIPRDSVISLTCISGSRENMTPSRTAERGTIFNLGKDAVFLRYF